MQNQTHHINPRPQLPATPGELTHDVLDLHARQRGTWLFVVSGVLLLLGVAGFVMRVRGGFEDREAWGYFAAVFVFLLSTAQAAPILAVATRLTKGYWRKPLVRVAELFTVVGLLNFLLFLPLLLVLPPLEGRNTFWVAWPGAPQWPLLVGMLTLVICGLGLLYTSARPDLATARDHVPGGRSGPGAALAGNWGGTAHQWKIMQQGVTYFGIFYLMSLVAMHFLVSVEFAITLVPGWRDPIFPAYHAISSLQAGLATLILALGILRAVGYRDYLALDQFWNPAKILLGFTLLWFYFWWSGFIVFWYGRTPAELGVLETVIFGPYLVPFAIGFICNFVVPLLLLIWNPIRVSIKGPIIASSFILVGNFLDRVRIYASSFSVDPPTGHVVEHIPATHFPDAADYLLALGAVGGVIFLFMLAMRIIPVLSLWELKELQLLTRPSTLLRSEVVIYGKPE